MKVVDIERVVILMRFIQYGWDEERKKRFDDNLRMMLETQCEDLDKHDKQIRAEAIEEFEPLLDLFVEFENDYICGEMCSSDYCEENCRYNCPQKECYLQYIKWQKGAENELSSKR